MKKVVSILLCVMMLASNLLSAAVGEEIAPATTAEATAQPQQYEEPEQTAQGPVEPTGEVPVEPTVEPPQDGGLSDEPKPSESPSPTPDMQPTEPFGDGHLLYAYIDGELVVAGLLDDVQVIQIPAQLNGQPVVGIGDRAFESCDGLSYVEIDEGVTQIGKRAFADCESLAVIALPESLVFIAPDAFENTPLLVFSVTQGSYADEYCQAWMIAHPRPEQQQNPDEEATTDGEPGTGDEQSPADGEQDTDGQAVPNGDEEQLELQVEGAQEQLSDEQPDDVLQQDEAQDDQTDSDDQTPLEPDASIAILGQSVLASGKSAKLTCTITSVTNIAQTVAWSIDCDKSVATLSGKGLSATVKAAKGLSAPVDVHITAQLTSLPEAAYTVAEHTLTLFPAASGVTVTAPRLYLDGMNPDDSITLTAVVSPQNGAQQVTWKTSSAAIATVDENGVVCVGKKAGTATITATAADGSGKKGTIKIKVLPTPAQAVTLTGATRVARGKSVKLVPAFVPQNASSKALVWQSNHPEIATVSKAGVVKGVAEGTADITATLADDPSVFATITVTVAPAPGKIEIVGATSVDIGSVQTVQLEARTVTDKEQLTGGRVLWKSAKPAIATVDENGLVTALKPGKTTITATATDGSGQKASLSLTVLKRVSAITLSGASGIAPAKNATLSATLTPTDATSKALKWESSDPAVATVKNGKVSIAKTAQPGQTVQIIASSVADGVVSDPFTITVTAPAPAFVLSTDEGVNPVDIDATQNQTIALYATSVEGNAPVAVTWKSSSAKVATVDANGVVTPLRAGNVTITATAADGSGQKASIKLVLRASVSGLTRTDDEAYTIAVGKSVTLGTSVAPAMATDRAIDWSSSATSVAVVSKAGKVTAKGVGQAVITAAKDGCTPITYQITVTAAPTKVVVTAEGGATYLNTAVSNQVKLSATVEGKSGTPQQSVVFESSNPAIATVDQNGLVMATGTRFGTVTISATTTDYAKKKGSLRLNIFSGGYAIRISAPDEVYEKGSATVTALLLPLSAKQDVVLSVSDKRVASISSSGVLKTKAVSAPTDITIRAQSKADPTLFAEHVVTIRPRMTTAVNIRADSYIISTAEGYNTLQLTATCEPQGVSNAVTWTSSNPAVISVDKNGLAVAHKVGGATITALAADGSGKSARRYLRVAAAPKSINITGSGEIGVGKSLTLHASVTPANAFSAVTWSSSDETLLTVDASGVITAASVPAKTTVTVSATSIADQSIVATRDVVIYPSAVQSVTLADYEKQIALTSTTRQLSLSVDVQPADACQTLAWRTSNPNVATVEDGVVQLVGAGEVTITAETVDGSEKMVQATITVHVPATGVSITGRQTMISAAELQLVANVEPENASNKTVTWSVTPQDAATIDENGLLSAAALDAITQLEVTATTQDGGFTATHTVTVYPSAVQSITLSPAAVYLDINSPTPTQTVTATVQPTGACPNVTWASSNESVATVDENGVVTAVGIGTASITATAEDGSNMTAEAAVSVMQSDYAYVLDGDNVKLTGYTGSDTQIDIPQTVMGRPVTALGEGIFAGNTTITTVHVPANITEIPDNAFYGCTTLTSVTLPNGVVRIGKRAFSGCTSLSEMTVSK